MTSSRICQLIFYGLRSQISGAFAIACLASACAHLMRRYDIRLRLLSWMTHWCGGAAKQVVRNYGPLREHHLVLYLYG